MSVLIEKNVAVPMRDGTKLKADVYKPADHQRHPVLLQRTPYNKELWPITALTLDPVRAAEAGYTGRCCDASPSFRFEGRRGTLGNIRANKCPNGR